MPRSGVLGTTGRTKLRSTFRSLSPGSRSRVELRSPHWSQSAMAPNHAQDHPKSPALSSVSSSWLRCQAGGGGGRRLFWPTSQPFPLDLEGTMEAVLSGIPMLIIAPRLPPKEATTGDIMSQAPILARPSSTSQASSRPTTGGHRRTASQPEAIKPTWLTRHNA